jgi:hypothetical protein
MNTNLNAAYGVCQVIRDPDPDGGFPSGAQLSGLWPMLKSGVWTPGTLLRVEGKRYLVLGTVGQPQRLVVRR